MESVEEILQLNHGFQFERIDRLVLVWIFSFIIVHLSDELQIFVSSALLIVDDHFGLGRVLVSMVKFLNIFWHRNCIHLITPNDLLLEWSQTFITWRADSFGSRSLKQLNHAWKSIIEPRKCWWCWSNRTIVDEWKKRATARESLSRWFMNFPLFANSLNGNSCP